MTLKKDTDVLDIVDEGGNYHFLVKLSSPEGKKLIKALESVLGSPTLDDYGISEPKEAGTITIKRYRIKKDIKLANHD